MRKTVKIAELIEETNKTLRTSTFSLEQRAALCTFVETILFNSDCYDGFGYLGPNEVPQGCKPGINLDDDGLPSNSYSERFKDTDQYRRFYYLSYKLR